MYCYLIACNFDGREQLLWPSTVAAPNLGDRQQAPTPLTHLAFPSINPQTAKPRGIVLDDDKVGGTQAFLVAASRKPLPAYEDWARARGPMPWRKLTGISGVWRCDGNIVNPMIKGEVRVRGALVDLEGQPPLLQLAGWARGQGVEVVEAIAFSVAGREGK